MITVILRGKLGERFGRKWELYAKTPAEALHAIDILKGGFFNYISELEAEMQGYHVQVGQRTIGEEMLTFGFAGETVTITPLLQGADTKGILQIVAGVALIAVGLVMMYYQIPFGANVALLGLGLVLGGVARMLMHAPNQTTGNQDPHKSSYIFTGAVNTIQQGECVPVAYGMPITGSAVVSAGMESENIVRPTRH
jgi:predicted phage tail protein